MSYLKRAKPGSIKLKNARTMYEYYLLRKDFLEGLASSYTNEHEAKIRRCVSRASFYGRKYLKCLSLEFPARVNAEREKIKALESIFS